MSPLQALVSAGFRCPCCGSGATPRTFPLCEGCARALVRAPALCPTCASPVCPQAAPGGGCLRPWARSGIHSYSAAYLLVNPCYRVLKRWKLTGGPLFNRTILRADDGLRESWREFNADAIVTVPQRAWRAWRMKGSPSERIARFVSAELSLPIVRALEPSLARRGTRRQAELSGEDRYANPIAFAPGERLTPGARLILVDDFMTSGRTLREAAAALLSLGAGAVHVFCLGLRLTRSGSAGAQPSPLSRSSHGRAGPYPSRPSPEGRGLRRK
ncbi:MAG: hypothetical protein NDJ90_02305 [Oligoflexia bacterium]|nr:hypothetical protein [Oligoflexia bacterium]